MFSQHWAFLFFTMELFGVLFMLKVLENQNFANT